MRGCRSAFHRFAEVAAVGVAAVYGVGIVGWVGKVVKTEFVVIG